MPSAVGARVTPDLEPDLVPSLPREESLYSCLNPTPIPCRFRLPCPRLPVAFIAPALPLDTSDERAMGWACIVAVKTGEDVRVRGCELHWERDGQG